MRFLIVTSLLLSSLSSFSQTVAETQTCKIGSLSVSVKDNVNFKYQDAISILRNKGYEIDLDIPTLEFGE